MANKILMDPRPRTDWMKWMILIGLHLKLKLVLQSSDEAVLTLGMFHGICVLCFQNRVRNNKHNLGGRQGRS